MSTSAPSLHHARGRLAQAQVLAVGASCGGFWKVFWGVRGAVTPAKRKTLPPGWPTPSSLPTPGYGPGWSRDRESDPLATGLSAAAPPRSDGPSVTGAHGNGNCTFLTETESAFLGAGPWMPRCCCPDAAPGAWEPGGNKTWGQREWVPGSTSRYRDSQVQGRPGTGTPRCRRGAAGQTHTSSPATGPTLHDLQQTA